MEARIGLIREYILSELPLPPKIILVEEPLPPGAGLVLEEHFFNNMSHTVLLVWRHRPSVVVGRSTRLDLEVDCEAAVRLGIPVMRRKSGGGAVYHDEGNINFSLILPTPSDKRVYPGWIYSVGTLLLRGLIGLLGLESWVENKSDIVVDGWKVSGGAAYISAGKALYHATLLVESNIPLLHMLVKPRLDLVAKGFVTPAKYRPANLSTFDSTLTINKVLRALYSYSLNLGITYTSCSHCEYILSHYSEEPKNICGDTQKAPNSHHP